MLTSATLLKPSAAERLGEMFKLREKLEAEQQLNLHGLYDADASGDVVVDALAAMRYFIAAAKILDDWPLVIACCQTYQRYLQDHHCIVSHGERIDMLRLLAKAYQQLGLFAEAETCLQKGLLKYYQNQSLARDYRHCLQAKQCLPKGCEALCADKLRLTLMRPCHRQDFFWQYSDTIADLCKLPDFGDDDEEDWGQWLFSYQRRPWSHMFAINHSDWGFIGSAGIEVSRGIGFVFYWLGSDFQGNGFTPRAVACLLEWAGQQLHLDCCYAVVYQDNIPSKKLLTALNFYPIRLKIASDYEEYYEQEYVYYRGPRKTDRHMFFELNQFFIDIRSELRVLALATASGWQ